MEKRNVYDVLMDRGFIEQATHADEIRELLGKEQVTFYIGFDPTADSLHVGHFIQLMVMMHMQRAGHRPIALLGAGTAKVGDPSGRTDMRQMLTNERLNANAEKMRAQMEKYLVLDGDKGLLANNADWLDNLSYIPFLREIGSKFSVNRMLEAECFKSRLDRGLSFLEFNYMIMQAYDFLELNRRYDCKLQMGGNDQWSNIIAGVNLIRKEEREQAFGLTFTLLTTSEGHKMGKTANGALWIDREKTSPYEFYQYFRNVDDADVNTCLRLLTFLPMDEVNRLSALAGAEINKAKETMAYEVTKLVHGAEEADKALAAAKALFEEGSRAEDIPTTEMTSDRFEGEGVELIELMEEVGLAPSKSEAKRLVKQGGVSLGDEKIKDFYRKVTLADFEEGEVLIRRGKKKYHRIVIA